MAAVGSPGSGRTKAAPPNSTPVEADGTSGDGGAGFRSPVRRFDWVSSSPAPAEIAALERRFPEVLQVPSQVLADESEDWGMKAVIARSLSRWVPNEAIVRELRRAGAAGGIEALAMAHRHYMLRFDDPGAKALALSRPWIVNGQPIAMEIWQPEFVPSEDSISSVLLWIRLPSLPIEFWLEPIVRSILSAAGDFVCLDAATRDRKRAGFARGCVRVNLRKPLRPGVRVRGMSNPFWQPFVYEHLEGICSACGSLHQGDSCGSVDETAPPSSPPLYGPWMAALRRPRFSNGKVPEVGNKASKQPASSSADWQLPKKPARRMTARDGVSGVDASASAVRTGGVDRPSASPVVAKESLPFFPSATAAANLSSPKASVEGGLACRSLVSVPVLAGDLREHVPTLQKASSDSLVNPFSLVGSDKWAGRPKAQFEANPGPLKRARPVESGVPKVLSKASKGKGKLAARGKGSAQATFVFTAAVGELMGNGTLSDFVPKSSQTDEELNTAVTDEAPQLSSQATQSHDSVVCLLKKAIRVDPAVQTLDCQDRGTSMGVPIDNGPIDTVMLGDREPPPDTE